MLRTLSFAPCLLLAAASVCQGAQILVNPFFENLPDHQASWVRNNSNSAVIQYATVPPIPDPNFMVPGLPPDYNVPPNNNGPWGWQVQHGNSPSAKGSNITQNVNVVPGTYKISASALVRIFDNSIIAAGQSTATLRLRADTVTAGSFDQLGDVVFSHHRGGTNNGWSGWTTMQTPEFIVNVESQISFRMIFNASAAEGSHGTNYDPGPFAQLVGDSFQLHAELIPEPATVVLGCVGAIACVATQRRRRLR